MDKENRRSANRDRSYGQEHARTAFCEELLSCCACGTIYFSKQPIVLPSLSRRTFHICLACSRTLRCSTCGKPVSPMNILAVENLPNSRKGLLCPRCRTKFLGRDQALPSNSLGKLYATVVSGLSTLFGQIRKLLSIDIFPTR